MGKLSLKDKVCILISLALMLTYCAAEQEYFPQNINVNWSEARRHCQVCYKDLVTVTHENIQKIVQNLSSDYWVGLRKNFTDHSTRAWTRWANGDPLLFQNWYPGWPVFKSFAPQTQCCSCACTCPALTTSAMPSSASFTDFTTESWTNVSSYTDVTDQTVTPVSGVYGEQSHTSSRNTTVFTAAPPIEAECVRSPMLPPDVPETEENYIEDSCVAMLSFGAWVEKNCTDLLPYICYDERFFGQANVTQVTPVNATLTWLPGPQNTDYYCVVVNNETMGNVTELTYDLVNLTAGTHYSFQVFPVKCSRKLNPQAIAFYTTPNKVENLSATVTETSISLSWSKPAGNVDFYLTKVQGQEFRNKTESIEIPDLISGSLYTITVRSEVADESIWSEESSISVYTKPGKASNLQVSVNTEHWLLLSWERPKGYTTGFLVKAMNSSNYVFYENVVNQSQANVTDLPKGTKITLTVTGLTNNNTLEGDKETNVSYTAPGPITNLNLVSTHNSIDATWNIDGSYSGFSVTLLLEGTNEEQNFTVETPQKNFDGLKNAANYTVIVKSLSGHIPSLPVAKSIYTLPLPPTDPELFYHDTNQLTFKWKPPVNISKAQYYVTLSSSFWGFSFSALVSEQTNYTFPNLKSGTLYKFEVRTIADKNLSSPVILSNSTDAKPMEISLSMLCSSQEALLCDNSTTRESVFQQLQAHFNNELMDIFWKLEKQGSEN